MSPRTNPPSGPNHVTDRTMPASQPMLSVHNIEVIYDHVVRVLKGVSLEVPFVSRSDPAAQWTGVLKGHAFFASATNYLIDMDHAVIVDVEASRAIRQAEIGAARPVRANGKSTAGLAALMGDVG
jgi:hypothetical protein